jgi:hypothetical protein
LRAALRVMLRAAGFFAGAVFGPPFAREGAVFAFGAARGAVALLPFGVVFRAISSSPRLVGIRPDTVVVARDLRFRNTIAT